MTALVDNSFVITQGSTWASDTIQWQCNGVAKDISAHTIRCKFRKLNTPQVILFDLSTSNGRITIVDASTGQFQLGIPASVTSSLGLSRRELLTYDIEADDGTTVTPLMRGTAKLIRESTR